VTDVAEALERLRARFRTRAAADLTDLRRWSTNPDAHQDELHALVHRLAGAAGTFGFDRLSHLAARAEDALIVGAADRLTAIADVIDELKLVSEAA
jgi:HPt (histidine-containing phosphotransfer) domain-containing protein